MHDAIYYLIMAVAIGWALLKTFPKNAPPSVPVDPGELEHLEDQYWEQVAELEAVGEDWREHGNIQPAWPDGFEIRSQEDDPELPFEFNIRGQV